MEKNFLAYMLRWPRSLAESRRGSAFCLGTKPAYLIPIQDMDLVKNHCVRMDCQPTSQQYCSLILNQHQPPASSQSTVFFSHNKSAPTISHSQANTSNISMLERFQQIIYQTFYSPQTRRPPNIIFHPLNLGSYRAPLKRLLLDEWG